MKSYVTFLGAVLPAIGVLAMGCSKPSAPVASGPVAPVAPSSPVATNPPPSNAPPAPTDPTDQPKGAAPTIDQIPAEVKTEAFDYEGLANTQLQKFVDTASTSSPSTGTFQVTLKEIKDGKAIFEEVSTGGIAGEQTEKMSADAIGIYHEELAPAKLLTPHVIELPAKPAPRLTWTDKTSIDYGAATGSSMVFTGEETNKVVGIQSIKIKLGTFDALEVDTTGTGTFNKDPITVSEKRWFVKGVGIVKQTQIMKLKSRTVTQTREFTK